MPCLCHSDSQSVQTGRHVKNVENNLLCNSLDPGKTCQLVNPSMEINDCKDQVAVVGQKIDNLEKQEFSTKNEQINFYQLTESLKNEMKSIKSDVLTLFHKLEKFLKSVRAPTKPNQSSTKSYNS